MTFQYGNGDIIMQLQFGCVFFKKKKEKEKEKKSKVKVK